MLKDQSTFKTSTGDEAATKSLGMGVVTHTIQGEASFIAWSMDVKFEGQNVDRHLDMMMHNEQCKPANTPTWPYTSKMTAAFKPGGTCEGMKHLQLQPYDEPCPRSKGGRRQTGHHLLPGRCMDGIPDYNHGHAPVICVSGRTQHKGAHKRCHARFDPVELDHFTSGDPLTYSDARDAAASSAGQALNPPRDLSEEEKACVAFQMDQYYKAKPPKGAGLKNGDEVATQGKPGKVIPKAASPSRGAR